MLDLPCPRCETGNYPRKTMATTQGRIITIGVTGASGAMLAQKALTLLEDDPRVSRIHLVVTETGQRLFSEELGITSGDLKKLPSRILGRTPKKIEPISNKDVGASIASGSYAVDAMIVIPCTMGALASIATGMSDDLVARAADVMLKEQTQAHSLRTRHAVQSHPSGKYAARAASRCRHHARGSRVLLQAENNRRNRDAIRLPRPRASRASAGKNVSLDRQRRGAEVGIVANYGRPHSHRARNDQV